MLSVVNGCRNIMRCNAFYVCNALQNKFYVGGGKLKDAKELNKKQEILVDSVGLYHADWLCTFEDAAYMHLLKKESNPAEIKIIDKKKELS